LQLYLFFWCLKSNINNFRIKRNNWVGKILCSKFHQDSFLFWLINITQLHNCTTAQLIVYYYRIPHTLIAFTYTSQRPMFPRVSLP
jgi:hypothetical protein